MIHWKTSLSAELPPPLRDLKQALRMLIEDTFSSLTELSESTAQHSESGRRLSTTTLSEAASGEIAPTWDTVLAIYRSCGYDGRKLPPEFQHHETWSDLHSKALRAAEREKRSRAVATSKTPATWLSPRELPTDVYGFVGRRAQLNKLDGLLEKSRKKPSAVLITAVAGTAGVGKTALAVHWSHRVREQFPDGHLYIDLRGYDPDQPVQTAEALGLLLRSLGVDGPAIPATVDEMARRYRSLLHGRKMLIVLDNARDSEQVRLLLPGTLSCFVVITSRDSLAAIVARYGARRLDIDLLPAEDAATLLELLIGERVRAEPEATQKLVAYCARLPLALRIAAEVAAFRSKATLSQLVEELEDEQRRLDLLNAGNDPHTALRAVFSWSYGYLPVQARRSFRLLGVNPGRDVDRLSASALLDIDEADARKFLMLLARANLIREVLPGRFSMHDLLRVYARERSTKEDSTKDQQRALAGLVGYYQSAARRSIRSVYPDVKRSRMRYMAEPRGSSTSLDFSGSRQALTWLNAERENILLLVKSGRMKPIAIVALSHILEEYLRRYGYYAVAESIHTAALNVIMKKCSDADQATILDNLGGAYLGLGRYIEAAKTFEKVIELSKKAGLADVEMAAHNGLGVTFEAQGEHEDALRQYSNVMLLSHVLHDRSFEARALINMGVIYWRIGQHELALQSLTSGLNISRDLNDTALEGIALGNLGILYWRLGRYAEAVESVGRALEIVRETGNRRREALTLDNLGAIYERMGHYEKALACHEEARKITRDIGSRAREGAVLDNIGIVNERLGRFDTAIDLHSQALDISRETGDRGLECEALTHLGRARRGLKQLDESLGNLKDALSISRELGQLGMESVAHNELGRTYWALSDGDAALKHHSVALKISEQTEDRYEQARALQAIGELKATSDVERSRESLRKSFELYRDLGVPEARQFEQQIH